MTDVESPSYMAQEGSNCCENCRFWLLMDPYVQTGKCRRHAPRELSGSFPNTYHDVWCGEWEPKHG